MSDLPEASQQVGTSSDSPGALEPTAQEPTRILYADDDRRGSLVREYFRTLKRYRGLILAVAICGLVVSVLMNLGTLPIYRARTSLDIQSLNSDFMDMRAIAATGDSTDSSSDVYVQTQIKLLQSESLLDRTVRHMQSDPHPPYIEQMDLVSRLERALHLVRHKPLAYADVIADASKKVMVKPLGTTRLVEITCDSWNADFSAKFCNTLVEQFKQADLEMRAAESQRTSDWLIQQVKDVKLKAEQSQQKLKEATGGNGMILSQNSTGVEEDRLRDLQDQYVRAEADRMEKEAEAGIGSSFDPDLNRSPGYQQYAIKLSDLQAEVAKLVPPLTEENPQVIHLRSQIKSVQAAMAAERVANATRLKSDYEASLHRETMLANAYHREEASVSAELGKASEVSLLRGEVQSEQQLYQTLLQRAREAGFASAMRASTVRVVDAAKPNPVPFSPRRGNQAASGLLLGAACGVALAFLFERSTTLLRAPGDAERYLGLRELGVIPSSVRERQMLASVQLNSLPRPPASPRETQPTLSNWTGNFSIVAEAYRSATTSIMLSENPREKGRVYVVSSPNPGEGKTTVISNIGVALSKSRLRVLLIDGDLRKPALHKVLEVPNEFGLRNLLRGESKATSGPSDHPLYQSTELPNLFVLPSGQGSEEVVELLHSSQAADIFQRLRRDFDLVIIDTPPMLHMADARILASHANGVILVVRSGRTSRDEATKARDIFDQDRVRLVGTILNDFDPNKSGLNDYYKSYQRYMYGPPVDANRAASWVDWLLSRDKWILQRAASKIGGPGAENGATTEFPSDAARNGAGNGAHGAANGASSQSSRGGAETVYGEIIPPPSRSTFFTKVLGWSSVSENPTEVAEAGANFDGSLAPSTEDRRTAKRKDLPQLVAYYWDGGASLPHGIRDISATGFYIVTDIRWYVGTQVVISLQRPDVADGAPYRSITVNARVVRFGVDGLGFAFVTAERKPSSHAGSSSRGAEISRLLGPGSRGADNATYIRFLQQLPRNQDQG
jgi:capsular exopolysaccharide synthesis family protein